MKDAEVISIFSARREQKASNTSSQQDTPSDEQQEKESLDAVIARNAATKARLAQERTRANRQVIKSYKLKR